MNLVETDAERDFRASVRAWMQQHLCGEFGFGERAVHPHHGLVHPVAHEGLSGGGLGLRRAGIGLAQGAILHQAPGDSGNSDQIGCSCIHI